MVEHLARSRQREQPRMAQPGHSRHLLGLGVGQPGLPTTPTATTGSSVRSGLEATRKFITFEVSFPPVSDTVTSGGTVEASCAAVSG